MESSHADSLDLLVQILRYCFWVIEILVVVLTNNLLQGVLLETVPLLL